MKQNRSNRFTKGLVCTLADSDSRFFFFELDKEHREFFQHICDFYGDNDLDYIVHRTGGGGFHFISPTMISKEGWKRLHTALGPINPKCPMTTLRVEPNKYPNEDQIWYRSKVEKWNCRSPQENNYQLVTYLNKIFGSDFVGTGAGEIKFTRYPLPLKEGEIPL